MIWRRKENAERFQFSLKTVIVLSTVLAVIAAVLRATGMPHSWLIALTIYLFLLTTYAVLRVPFVSRPLRGKSAAWQKIRTDREQLTAFADEKRREKEAQGSGDHKRA